MPTMVEKLVLSEAEWRARLTPEEFAVLRGHGTERPHTGCFVATKTPGVHRKPPGKCGRDYIR